MSLINTVISSMQLEEDSRTELDSHADTCVVGDNALIIHEHNRTVDVVGYEGSAGRSKRLKVVDAAVAYEGFGGEFYILRLNQAIYVKGLPHNLLCLLYTSPSPRDA